MLETEFALEGRLDAEKITIKQWLVWFMLGSLVLLPVMGARRRVNGGVSFLYNWAVSSGKCLSFELRRIGGHGLKY